jgi:hypothetical protein
MSRGLACVAWLLAAAVLRAGAPEPPVIARGTWVAQQYAAAPPDNPLKGLLPFRGRYTAFPHSMEWGYIPWKDIQQGEDAFTWAPLDAFLDDIAGRGHQAVFRIYADYPNTPPALPDFLSGVARREYSDHNNGKQALSYAPDYDDPRMVRAMRRLIAALGARYDGDARIAFVTVGLLGFWGEWHAYRPSCNCDDWMASPATQRVVLDAFDDAFDRTKVLVRYADVGWDGHEMGFHDDSFAFNTVDPPDWFFMGRVRRADAIRQWRHHPIGGELTPTLQHCAFSVPACTPPGQEFGRSVDATHASWLMDHFAFQWGHTGGDYDRALAAARSLGYELFVSAVKLSDTKAGKAIDVEVRLHNRGVAPFYYDWPVWLGVADEHGQVVASFRTGWRLTRVIDPGKAVRFRAEVNDRRLRPGRYTVLMRAQNPLPNGKPLVFANAAWGRDVRDWLSLGDIMVRGD